MRGVEEPCTSIGIGVDQKDLELRSTKVNGCGGVWLRSTKNNGEHGVEGRTMLLRKRFGRITGKVCKSTKAAVTKSLIDPHVVRRVRHPLQWPSQCRMTLRGEICGAV